MQGRTTGNGVSQKVLRYTILGFMAFHRAVEKHVQMNLSMKIDQGKHLFVFEFEGFEGDSQLMARSIFNKQRISELIKEETTLNFYLLRNLIQNYNGIFIPDNKSRTKIGFKILLYVD